MTALYITSLEKAAGKTALAAGLGRLLLHRGKKVGYFKPLRLRAAEAAGAAADADTRLLADALGLKAGASDLAPVALTGAELQAQAASPKPEYLERIRKAYASVSQGTDAVLVEGLSASADSPEAAVAMKVVEALNAKVVLLLRYPVNVESLNVAARTLGERLAGVVVNMVPPASMARVKAGLAQPGLTLLGVVPEDRRLTGATFDEIARHLGAEYLSTQDGADGLIENVALGVMAPDPVLAHYQRRSNKLAVVRGDRPDIQLAILGTSTRGLILTRGQKTIQVVLYHARENKVPVALVNKDTPAAVAEVESYLREARFHQKAKLALMEDALRSNLDFTALYRSLGLPA